MALALVVTAACTGYPGETRGLLNEPMLHPGDAFTARTLRQGELIYNQSPQTLPLPSWAWWGVTDWLTAEIDLLPLLGGFFIEPHLPVPSFNFRFRLRDGGGEGLSLAYETMLQYNWEPFAQVDGPHLHILREGLSWFHRINLTQPLSESVALHLSAGFTYAESIAIENMDREVYHGRAFSDLLTPDVSVAIDWRVAGWLSLHASTSIGTTFVYLDNVPRKAQVMGAFRVAPFYRSRYAFLRTFRIESSAFAMYLPDADEWFVLPLPVIPYFYWQWRI